MSEPRSPYEVCAPPDLLARLDPGLRTYFAGIPAGHVGRGEGVFSVVGTPRWWFRPVLALFALDGVMFPVWEHDVPFTVENRPGTTGSGRPTVRAARTFRFRSGPRVMVDAISADPEGLVDHLGRHGTVRAALRIEERDGALRLVSTGVALHVLGMTLPVPSAVAPRVTLDERHDDATAVQRVSLVLTAPFVGTLYRYEGTFRCRIVPDADADADADADLDPDQPDPDPDQRDPDPDQRDPDRDADRRRHP